MVSALINSNNERNEFFTQRTSLNGIRTSLYIEEDGPSSGSKPGVQLVFLAALSCGGWVQWTTVMQSKVINARLLMEVVTIISHFTNKAFNVQ